MRHVLAPCRIHQMRDRVVAGGELRLFEGDRAQIGELARRERPDRSFQPESARAVQRGRGESLMRGHRLGVVPRRLCEQRGGDVRLSKIAKANKATLHAFIKGHIHPKTKLIVTDEALPYRGIHDEDTRHEVVNHRRKEYVRGDIHTNTIENVWSLLKRSVAGSYHKISEKHIDRYLDELEWRYNNRSNPYLFRDTLVKLLGSSNLEYKELVAA